MDDSYARSNLAFHQRIVKEDMARLRFAGEIRARQMEHEVKNPGKEFRPFQRKILPHLLDASDVASDAGSISSYTYSTRSTSPQRRHTNERLTRSLSPLRPATSSIELEPFSSGQRFNETLSERVVPRTASSVSSTGSMKSTNRTTSSSGSSTRRPGTGLPDRFNSGIWTPETRSTLSTPETPAGAAMYRIKGTNYLRAKKMYGNTLKQRKKNGLGTEERAAADSAGVNRVAGSANGSQLETDALNQSNGNMTEASVDQTAAMSIMAEQQKTLQKLESLEKEILEEKSGRLQVQKELRELRELLESTLKAQRTNEDSGTSGKGTP